MTPIAQKLQQLSQEKQQNPQLRVINKLLDLFPFLPEEGDQGDAIEACIEKFGTNFSNVFYEFCETAKNSADFKALVETLDVSEAGQLIKNILYNAVCDQRRREPAIKLSRTVSQTLNELSGLNSPDKRFFSIENATSRALDPRPYSDVMYYDTFCDFILKVAQWNWDIEEVLKKDDVSAQLASFIQRSYFATDLKSFAGDLFFGCPQFEDKMLSLDDPSLAQVINAYLYQEFDFRHRKGAPYDCEGIIGTIDTLRQLRNQSDPDHANPSTPNRRVGDALTTYLHTAIELGGCISGLYPPNSYAAYDGRTSRNPSPINPQPIPEKMARIVEMFYQDSETSLQTCPSLQSILMNFSEYDLSKTVRAVLEQKAYRDIGPIMGNPEKEAQRDIRLEEINKMIKAVQTFQIQNSANPAANQMG
jgi:hypothetical protein